MKKYLLIIVILAVIGLLSTVYFQRLNTNGALPEQQTTETELTEETPDVPGTNEVGMANQASRLCEGSGGKVEIITQKDGSQFGLCVFEDYACDEWVLYRNDCNIEEDAKLIEQALIAKGLSLSGMKVVINKHLGRDISGSVVPVSEPAGGGYVFASKENGVVKIVADGNGIISCKQLEEFPDYSTYLIPSCVNDNGDLIER